MKRLITIAVVATLALAQMVYAMPAKNLIPKLDKAAGEGEQLRKELGKDGKDASPPNSGGQNTYVTAGATQEDVDALQKITRPYLQVAGAENRIFSWGGGVKENFRTQVERCIVVSGFAKYGLVDRLNAAKAFHEDVIRTVIATGDNPLVNSMLTGAHRAAVANDLLNNIRFGIVYNEEGNPFFAATTTSQGKTIIASGSGGGHRYEGPAANPANDAPVSYRSIYRMLAEIEGYAGYAGTKESPGDGRVAYALKLLHERKELNSGNHRHINELPEITEAIDRVDAALYREYRASRAQASAAEAKGRPSAAPVIVVAAANPQAAPAVAAPTSPSGEAIEPGVGKALEDRAGESQPGGAITVTGEELTPQQHADVNEVIAEYFDSFTKQSKTAQPLNAAELNDLGAGEWAGKEIDGVKVEVFVISGLSQFDDILVAHPGRGGKVLEHTRKRVYLSPTRVETVKLLSAPAQREFWAHEAGHLTMAYGASEKAVQAQYPIDLVREEVAIRLVNSTLALDARDAVKLIDGGRAALRSEIPELKGEISSVIFSAEAIFDAGLGAVLPAVVSQLNGMGTDTIPTTPPMVACVYRNDREKAILEKILHPGAGTSGNIRTYDSADTAVDALKNTFRLSNIKYVGTEASHIPAGVERPVILVQRIIEALGRVVGNATVDIDKAVRDFAALCGKA